MVTLTLPPEPASVARARAYVSDALHAVGSDLWAREPAVLLTSELVTNGILHGRTDVEVRLDLTDDAVRVEVADGGTGCPVAEQVSPDAERGRGLMIVSRVASRWGVELATSRTVVWFELRYPRLPTRPRRRGLVNAVVAPVRSLIGRFSQR